ncbi:MAG: ABC transporter ATP-binding protein [Spirochaetales bacterium]|nr:ABC transporter ATP-binding protein [Spirochaetales bacterium]
MASVTLRNIHYDYKRPRDALARRSAREFSLRDVNLDIPDGKSTVILGPSGCGKTTLLKIIAGLITPDHGAIAFNGESVDRTKPGDRRIGMVFQDYALYPHLDSKDNITSFFLFRRRTKELDRKKKELFERTSALLDVDISYLLRRKPPTLSGGEKQRVAVGRCITREPQLFLLDEPFSNLDRSLREKYRLSLKKLLEHFHITTVYVTHDQVEAAVLADELVVMNSGRVEQTGSVRELFDNPKNRFVAGFLSLSGDTVPMNFIDGGLVDRSLAGMVIGARPDDVEVTRSVTEADVRGAVVTEVRPVVIQDLHLVSADYRDVVVQAKSKIAPVPARGEEVNLVFKKYFLFDHITERLVRRVVKGEEPAKR